jgi:hypothetical protein
VRRRPLRGGGRRVGSGRLGQDQPLAHPPVEIAPAKPDQARSEPEVGDLPAADHRAYGALREAGERGSARVTHHSGPNGMAVQEERDAQRAVWYILETREVLRRLVTVILEYRDKRWDRSGRSEPLRWR